MECWPICVTGQAIFSLTVDCGSAINRSERGIATSYTQRRRNILLRTEQDLHPAKLILNLRPLWYLCLWQQHSSPSPHLLHKHAFSWSKTTRWSARDWPKPSGANLI